MKIIITDNNQAEVYTPYNSNFVTSIKKQIGSARWDSSKKCWVVPDRSVEFIREIMEKVYGETDIAPQEHIDVKVKFNEDVYCTCEPLVLFARNIVIAYGRDSGAKVGEGVELVEGNISSGGSMKNWKTQIQKGTVLIIRDVCKTLIDDFNDSDILVENLDKAVLNKAKLLEEKEILLNRINEINKLLGIED